MSKTLTIIMLTSILFGSPDRPFHTTPDREKDMLHMAIDIEIDIPEGRISGSVTHTFTPFASDFKRVTFNSDRITIHKITLSGHSLDYIIRTLFGLSTT